MTIRQRLLTRLPAVLHVDVHDAYLVGVTHAGALPLYRYVPLLGALHSGQDVPLAPHWPEHLKLFIYTYSPVPVFGADQLPIDLAGRFGRCSRQADSLRPWDQATFQGWPLYTCLLDQPGSLAEGTVANLFERIHVEVLSLPPPGERTLGP